MAISVVAVPARIATQSGAAHQGKLARVERKLNTKFPGRNFTLGTRNIYGVHEIVIKASDGFFGGMGAEYALQDAFYQAL